MVNEDKQTRGVISTLIELRDLLATHKVDQWATHLNRVISGAEERGPKTLKNEVLQMCAGTMGSLTDLIISRVKWHDVDNEQEANAMLDRLIHGLFVQVNNL